MPRNPLTARALHISLLLLALALGGAGCEGRAPAASGAAAEGELPPATRFVLDTVSVTLAFSPSSDSAWITEARAAEQARTGMVSAPNWSRAGSGAPIRASIGVEIVDEPGHDRAVYVLFEGEARSTRRGTLESPLRLERVRAYLRESDVAPRIDFEVLDFARALADAVVLTTASDRHVIESLGDTRRELRLTALREVERRGLAQAAAAVETLLEPEDLELFAAATGALVRMGTEASTRVVVDRLDRHRRRELLLAVLPALPRLAGPEGRAYAEMVASGHTDPSVQAMARQALDAAAARPR